MSDTALVLIGVPVGAALSLLLLTVWVAERLRGRGSK